MTERSEVIERVQAGNRGLQISSDTRRVHIDAMESLLLSRKEEAAETTHKNIPTGATKYTTFLNA